MLAAARRRGMVSYVLAPRFADLLREIAAGNPVVVLIDQGIGPLEYWHYAVAMGYDYDYGQLILRSGSSKCGPAHRNLGHFLGVLRFKSGCLHKLD